MRTLRTKILINAPIESVWQKLVNIKDYNSWADFLHYVEGPVHLGSQLKLKVKIGNLRTHITKIQMTRVDLNQSLRWRGTLVHPKILTGDHAFGLHKVSENQTLIYHFEIFSGLLVPFIWGSFIQKYLRPGFQNFNRSLKKHTEAKCSLSTDSYSHSN